MQTSTPFDTSVIVVDLRNTIADLLTAEIGTLAQTNRPAIWVEPPETPIGGTGLQVVIQRFSIKMTNALYQWKVTLLAYDKSQSGIQKLESAVCKLRQHFPEHREIALPFREDAYPQIDFYVIYRVSLSNYFNRAI